MLMFICLIYVLLPCPTITMSIIKYQAYAHASPNKQTHTYQTDTQSNHFSIRKIKQCEGKVRYKHSKHKYKYVHNCLIYRTCQPVLIHQLQFLSGKSYNYRLIQKYRNRGWSESWVWVRTVLSSQAEVEISCHMFSNTSHDNPIKSWISTKILLNYMRT